MKKRLIEVFLVLLVISVIVVSAQSPPSPQEVLGEPSKPEVLFPHQKVAYDFLQRCYDGKTDSDQDRNVPEIISQDYGHFATCGDASVDEFLTPNQVNENCAFQEPLHVFIKEFITDSHLCFNNGFISCLKRKDNGDMRYCDQQEINSMINIVKNTYGQNLPQRPVWRILGKGPNEELPKTIFDKGTDAIKNKWKIGNIKVFLEENKSKDVKDAKGYENLALKAIVDKFEKTQNRNLLEIFDIPGNLPDPNDEYHDDETPALLVPCIDSLKGTILDYRANEKDAVIYAYYCDGSEWKELMNSDFSQDFDYDSDSVPEPFDCNDNDPEVYGNFVKYGSIPRVVCNDNKENTCGIVDNEIDDCNKDAYACYYNCGFSGNSCDWRSRQAQNGYCCGSKVSDLGMIGGEDQNYLCLNRNFVSDNSLPVCGESNWCWLPSTAADTAYKIFTITKPGEKIYDIVSDNEKWHVCDGSKEIIESTVDNEHRKVANRFACYSEGDKYSWAECCDGDDCENKDSLKMRLAGDGLYTLPLNQNNNFDKEKYKQIYGADLPDFIGYDNLEFYLQFEQNVSGETQVQLELFRGENGAKGRLLSVNALSYVVNGVSFEANKKMHVIIPIADWKDVGVIQFQTIPEVLFNVSHLQLTSQQQSKVCLGKATAIKSAWAEDLDAYLQEGLSAKEACNNLGMQWLGNDIEPNSLRCCGNNLNEYYAGNGSYGCWNSQAVKENETISNLKVELTYGIGDWQYEYEPQIINGSYFIRLVNNSKITSTLSDYPITIDYSESPKVIKKFNLDKFTTKRVSLLNTTGASVYFLDPLDLKGSYSGMRYIEQEQLHPGLNEIYIVAETDKVVKNYNYDTKIEILDLTCNSRDCQFPLKGYPPYKVKNLMSNDYDLYYNYKIGTETKRILVEGEMEFYGRNGWLEAVNVPQQIIFSNSTFYSCGNISELAQMSNYCNVKSNHFCSPLNSWSTESLKKMVYDDESILGYSVPEEDVVAEKRVHFTSIVYGRNLLFNPWLGLLK